MDPAPYHPIQPPFERQLTELSKKELREHNQWFHQVLPSRIQELARVVASSPGFETWLPDFTPDSLNALGDWFAAQVDRRPRTQEENDAIPTWVGAPSWELTPRTFSFSADVGMYLCQVFVQNHPSLTWAQPMGSKRFIDYGHPVLMGFKGKVPLNGPQMLVTHAYGLVDGNGTGKDLRKIYDIWSAMVEAINKRGKQGHASAEPTI